MNPTRAVPLLVLNGPNLNLLGRREPAIYGTTTLAQIRERTLALAAELGFEDVDFRQTNHEGQLVDWIQEAFERDAAVVINPAGLSFASVPVLDALRLLKRPLLEVHLSNIHRRPPPHRDSLVSGVATGVVCGLGPAGYALAVRAVAALLDEAAASAVP